MSELFNPCYEHCYLRHGKQYSPECDSQCEYAKVVKENKNLKEELDELDRPIKTLEELALQVCLSAECYNCPVSGQKYETRTKEEKANHVPCLVNLIRWIQEQAKLADAKNKET